LWQLDGASSDCRLDLLITRDGRFQFLGKSTSVDWTLAKRFKIEVDYEPEYGIVLFIHFTDKSSARDRKVSCDRIWFKYRLPDKADCTKSRPDPTCHAFPQIEAL
jgi:hypothetical protein